MDTFKKMREEVKKYIDTADDKVVKMVHAMLEVDADADWWETVPDSVKEQVELSLQQSESGEVLSHEEVKAKHPQWFSK
jgi:uncharacterized protein HemY